MTADNYAEEHGWFGLLTGELAEAHTLIADRAVRNGQAGDDRAQYIVSVPAFLDKDRMEALGFTILDELPDDIEDRKKSFVRVRMPDGWAMQRGGDSRIRNIVDERGVKRIVTSDNGQWHDRYATTIVVRQGYEVPLRLCNGDGTLETVLWAKLTHEEREEVKEGLRQRIQEGIRSPKVYAKTAEKAQYWLDVIESPPSPA